MVSKEKKKPVLSFEAENLTELKSEEDVLEKVESHHINNIIREAVNSLKPSMRSTVVLYYYNNLTLSEIAKVLGCFQGTVKSRLHYAKKVLQKELKKELSRRRVYL